MHEVLVIQASERLPIVHSHAIPVNESSSVFGNRSDIDAINNTMTLSTQVMPTVSNMARRLQARVQENQQLINKVSLLQQQLANTRQEKRELESTRNSPNL